jgi:hypothetical protein
MHGASAVGSPSGGEVAGPAEHPARTSNAIAVTARRGMKIRVERMEPPETKECGAVALPSHDVQDAVQG